MNRLLSDPARRRFLKLIAASPLLPYLDLPGDWLAAAQTLAPQAGPIASARDAMSIFDFEPVARAKLNIGHWTWMATGGDDDGTIRANREGFERYQLRARRLVDISKIDMGVQLLGSSFETPIFLCPVAGHRAYHPDGELATARAAKARKNLQMLSTMTATAVEEVNAARGEPVWYQLYQRPDWSQTRQMLRRVEAAGCPALVFTVDLLGGRNMEQFNRVLRQNQALCSQCHANGDPLADTSRKPMITALTEKGQPEIGSPTWDYVKRLRDATGMKLLIKGIVTREDAELAVEHGVSGVYISNHGGRAENSLRPTILCVSEVAAGANGRVPVLVDGGFRRGTDMYKALALGATAVGVGRPYIWGLAAFGQEGVEAVLEILRRELQLIMRQTGTPAIQRIGRDHIRDAAGNPVR